MRLRSPDPSRDAEAVLDVVVARDVADLGYADFTLDDVRADWAGDDFAAVLAEEDDGEVVGYAFVDPHGQQVLVHPEHEGRGIGTRLRAWAEEQARERGEALRQPVAVANEGAREHLRRAGYEPVHVYLRLRAPLDRTPGGVDPRVRTFDLGAEGPAVHALVMEAFEDVAGNVAQSYDAWHATVERKSEPAFRLAADDGQGLAGAAHGERWEDGVGYVARIAVARRARGTGLGRALLLACFDAFRAAGLTEVVLSVQGANAPATGLYTSAGMREEFRQERWERR